MKLVKCQSEEGWVQENLRVCSGRSSGCGGGYVIQPSDLNGVPAGRGREKLGREKLVRFQKWVVEAEPDA